jgi:isoleucyl-tRNA synthetase
VEPRFAPVNAKQDFIELEHRVLEFWREARIFEQVARRNAGRAPWSFIDGPITANNPMGVHHAWGRTYKDVFQRYKAMRGFDQRWQNGFDCQGLWLEVETERELGFNSKRDIEAHGLDSFSRACRARVDKYSQVMTGQSLRLGQWMRWDDSYYTMSDTNIEYIWHFLGVCHDKGWLYEGHKAMPWCTRCGTSLSQHELTDGYEEVADTSVFLRFPLKGRPGESLLVWTTTPWTLTSNVAAAVNPDLDYLRVRHDGQIYWLSAGTYPEVFKKGAEILGKHRGEEMLGWGYDGPFDDLPAAAGVEHRVIPWGEVGETEGTGIVHIAPGCGAEDNELAKVHGLKIIAPLDGYGLYLGGFGWLAGMDVHDVEKPILANLKEKGVFFRQETYRHRYPFCWRCKEKLVFRVEDEWFLSSEEIRPRMKAAAETVRWIPDSVGKRTQDWYNNMGDWCISRKRYWGLPLPFYFCPQRHLTLVRSRAELRERALDPAIVDGLPELHRPWIDEVRIRCAHCDAEAKRIPDVGDCWLDAGIVGFSTLKYFEDRTYWEKWFPCELVLEMREQVRLWFYAMMFTAVTLDGRAPYKTVFSYEKVFDEKGKPMHKSTGNAIWFDDAVEKMGADVMRWLYCAFNPNNNLRFGYHAADDIRRRLITLWNVYGFFVTYASLDGFDPVEAQVEETLGQSPNPLDRWILSDLYRTLDVFTRGLEEYDVAGSLRAADSFLEALSTWYLRRSRRRFWKSTADDDKKFAYRTLFHALVTFSEMLAPVVPFLAEEIYRNLTGPLRTVASPTVALRTAAGGATGADAPGAAGAWPESVHLRPYPDVRRELIDDAMNARMERVLSSVSLGRAAREKVQIKVRQPLGRMWILSLDGAAPELDDDLRAQVGQELNIKQVLVGGDTEALVTRELKLNFAILGTKLGPAMKEVSKAAKDGAWTPGDAGTVTIAGHTLEPGEFDLQYAGRAGLTAAGDRNLLVVIDTAITEELLREGYAREIVRAVQDLRKQAGYNVEDRIRVYFDTADERVRAVVAAFGSYIAEETLAHELCEGCEEADQSADLEIEKGCGVRLGVKR